jgi:predicted metal-dependent enzyme (double-stranded beta helix superfamily)
MSGATYELENFVADLRGVLARDLPEDAKLEEAACALRRLLANPAALDRYRWALEQGRGPWLLYEDPDFGFCVTLLLKQRANSTPVHHHAEAWTLYGIFDGIETVHRYDRRDDGANPERADVRLAVDHVRRPGEVEIEPPYSVHNETTSADVDTVAIAVRGRNLALIQQQWFDLATGAVKTGPGNAAKPLPVQPG